MAATQSVYPHCDIFVSMKCYPVAVLALASVCAAAQAPKEPEKITMPPNRMAHILVVGQTEGFEHDSVPDAMANIWRMGHDTRLWDATLRTDTENITKKTEKKGNFKSLNYFDALIFASTTGELTLTEDQKQDMLSFIKDDGKGFDPKERRRGVGLSNILSRIELFDGKLEVISSKGHGCTLKVKVPKMSKEVA